MELIFIGLNYPDHDILLNEEKFLEKYTSEKLSFENKYINDWNFFNLLNFSFFFTQSQKPVLNTPRKSHYRS